MNPELQARLVAVARHNALVHPADLPRAMRAGMSQFRRRLLLVYLLAITAVGILFGGAALAHLPAGDPPIGGTAVETTASTPSIPPTLTSTTTTTTSTTTQTRSSRPSTAPPPTLMAIVASPIEDSFVVGDQRQLTAAGTYSDGSTRDVTTAVRWDSADPNIASVDDGGLVTGEGEGTTIVTASLDGRQDTATVAVAGAPPVLTAIVVTPAEVTGCYNTGQQQLTADGTYSDDSTRDVTTTVRWDSADPKIASVDDGGLVTGKGEGTTIVTASLDGSQDTATVTLDYCEP